MSARIDVRVIPGQVVDLPPGLVEEGVVEKRTWMHKVGVCEE
jgi:hypothetical protein